MNVTKLGIIAAAIAINVLVLAWFGTRPANTVSSTAPAARGEAVVTLPVTHVYPSAAQLRELHRERAPRPPAAVDGRAACVATTYGSASSSCMPAANG